MMDELVQELSQKTGLSPDKAQEVVNVVVAHLKTRLPEPLANGLDSFLNGSSTGSSSFAEEAKAVASGFGSLFGKKA
ncbi:MAG: DUF2267 domain-containing protein [Candidatus Acidiferrales bacterium]|jgi:hypothetical protein